MRSIGWRRFRKSLPLLPRHRLIDKLIYSIALEELALAQLIRALARQVRAVNRKLHGPVSATDLVDIQRGIAAIVQRASRKEKILTSKLRLVMSLIEREGSIAGDVDEFFDGHDDQVK